MGTVTERMVERTRRKMLSIGTINDGKDAEADFDYELHEHRAPLGRAKRAIDRENRLLARIAEVKRLVRGGMSIKGAGVRQNGRLNLQRARRQSSMKIKNEPERKAAAEQFAKLYDGPALGRLAKPRGSPDTSRRSAILRRSSMSWSPRSAAARFYEERDRQRLERIRQLGAEAEELEMEHDALLRRQGMYDLYRHRHRPERRAVRTRTWRASLPSPHSPCPLTDVLDGSGKWVEEIDVRAVLDWFVTLQTLAAKFPSGIEECPHHARKALMRSMAYSYGLLVNAQNQGIRPTPVPPGNPRKAGRRQCWVRSQRANKAYALAKAKELWPDEDFIPVGCRKPHDGIIDAALIAEFHRRKGV